MKRIITQLTDEQHALLNNDGFVCQLFRLNIGFKFIIDVQLLPTPRLWVRLPLIGEVILGLTQLEVCSDNLGWVADYLALEASLHTWRTVTTNDRHIWDTLPTPKLSYCEGNPGYWEDDTSVREWDMPLEELMELYMNGEYPSLMPRRLSHREDSVRFNPEVIPAFYQSAKKLLQAGTEQTMVATNNT